MSTTVAGTGRSTTELELIGDYAVGQGVHVGVIGDLGVFAHSEVADWLAQDPAQVRLADKVAGDATAAS